jgi:stage II sporulation protein D
MAFGAHAAKPEKNLVRVRTILSSYDLSKEMRNVGDGTRVFGPTNRIGKHHVEGVEKVHIRSQKNGKSEVVLHVNIEDYLKIVLPSEMPETWPIEALKAQAIASRSYVEAQMQNSLKNDWDVESTIMDQVFDLKHSRSRDQIPESVQKAVNQTMGAILIDKKNQTARAYFHADCGGATETAFHVWRTKDGTRSVQDKSCPTSPNSQWEISFTGEELTNKLQIPVLDLKVASYSPSKRVSTLYVKTAKFESELWSGEKLRRAIGFTVLKSTKFQIRKEEDRYFFRGKGYGHGVGLCQWGARQLALQGKTHEEILSHYYPQYSLKMITSRYASRP